MNYLTSGNTKLWVAFISVCKTTKKHSGRKTPPYLLSYGLMCISKRSLISPKTIWGPKKRFVQGLTGVGLCMWGTSLPLLPTPFPRAVNPTGSRQPLSLGGSGWCWEQMRSSLALAAQPEPVVHVPPSVGGEWWVPPGDGSGALGAGLGDGGLPPPQNSALLPPASKAKIWPKCVKK